MSLAIAEISNVLMAIGVLICPLPLEADRIIAYHLRRFFDMGVAASGTQVKYMRAQIEERDMRIRALEMEVTGMQQELSLLRRAVRKQ